MKKTAMTSEVFNFSAGPAVVPREVLATAQAELLDFRGSGMSVMEMSHRGKVFLDVASRAEASLRKLLDIPANYTVLFQQGGARTQFAAVPMNLRNRPGAAPKADYIDTGYWSSKGIDEARRFIDVNVAARASAALPELGAVQWTPDAAYVHYTPNETIDGVEFASPEGFPAGDGAAPLVADYSSTILSRPLDVSRFGVIYAGAQKNMGISGCTVLIIRDDLLGHATDGTPATLDWAVQAKADSMFNTPATFPWYLAGLVFDWILDAGGLDEMARRNAAKSGVVYGAIEASNFYSSPVAESARSWMNVPFTLADSALDPDFLAGAEAAGLHGLKGHRSVGGMRASLYNAMPLAGAEALVEYMREFERTRG